MEQNIKRERIKVEVLFVDDCVNADSAIVYLDSIARSQNIELEITKTHIKTQEEAEQQQFLGSPTIRINEIDIEASNSTSYGLG